MPVDRTAIVARARAFVGARFRAQGRNAADGLDCVGLAAATFDRGGVPDDYTLRGGSLARVAAGLRVAGLRAVDDRAPGDVLVMQAGPEQLHLGIWTGDGMVHADARLRRIVERPGAPAWPVIGIWRQEA